MSRKIRAMTWRQQCLACHLLDNAGVIYKGSRKRSAASCTEVLLITMLVPDRASNIEDPLSHTHGLCAACHAKQHRIGELTFWSALRIDPLNVALRLWTISANIKAGERTVFRARQQIDS